MGPTATIGLVRSAIVASLTTYSLVLIVLTRPTATAAGSTAGLYAAWLSSHLSQPFPATLLLRKVNKTKIKAKFLVALSNLKEVKNVYNYTSSPDQRLSCVRQNLPHANAQNINK